MSNVVKTNVIDRKSFRKYQSETLRVLADKIITSAGPMGSYTKIIKRIAQQGTPNENEVVSSYTKDGHTILCNINLCDSGLLCKSIKEDAVDVTTNVKKVNGDGSTGAVWNASKIFDELMNYEQEHPMVAPRAISKKFKEAIKLVNDKILENGREFTAEDAKNIAYVSSNGNDDVADAIYTIYKDYGKEVYIDVDISPTDQHVLNVIDGMNIKVGFNNPVYYNRPDGTCVLNNPHIYYFVNDIDTLDMVNLLEAIINDNIFAHKNDISKMIPTVIIAPRIGKDASAVMNILFEKLRLYNNPNVLAGKPPIVMITDTIEDGTTSDIAHMCGCSPIKKYIGKEAREKDEKAGLAPTVDTVSEKWFGTCEQVVVSLDNSKFLNPKQMNCTKREKRIELAKAEGKEAEEAAKIYPDDNEIVMSPTYEGYIAMLERQLDVAIKNKENLKVQGDLKRRIFSLKSKVVEYQIGGISPRDRDAVKDSVRDAVRNCRSSAENGIGYGCMMEAYFAIKEIKENIDSYTSDTMVKEFIDIIENSVKGYISILLQMSLGWDETEIAIGLDKVSREDGVIDLATGEISNKILSSIITDTVILDSIDKIVTLMISTCQAEIPDAMMNVYDFDVQKERLTRAN